MDDKTVTMKKKVCLTKSFENLYNLVNNVKKRSMIASFMMSENFFAFLLKNVNKKIFAFLSFNSLSQANLFPNRIFHFVNCYGQTI